MPENEKEGLPSNTNNSVPQEKWEQKMMANEKTAPLPPAQAQQDDKKEEKKDNQKAPKKHFQKPSASSVWAALLLLTFTVSALSGIYLSVRPVPNCKPAKEDKKEDSLSGALASRSRSAKKEGVAWIKIRGVIAQDNNTSPFSRPSGASVIAKKIREAGEDKNVKAIVLDINSPGGTVASVQNIYSEIQRAKKNKKVVALFRDVAASGGFYVAMAADKIVAEPGTITGSVGVIMQTGNVEGLFEKIGVKVTPITSGKYKDMGSAYRPMTDAEKAILQDMVDDTYGQFLAAVKAGRPNVKPEDMTEYTDGRIFTGQRAFNLGFIDKLGGEEEALQLAGELAGLKDPKIINQGPDSLREFIFSFGSSMESKTLAQQLQTLATPSVAYLWVH